MRGTLSKGVIDILSSILKLGRLISNEDKMTMAPTSVATYPIGLL